MPRILCLCALLILFFQQACSRPAYQGIPALPEKDWLVQSEDKKGEKVEKFQIYSPDKVMTFDDLVWLAVQQSPLISNSRIGIDIQEINKSDVNWRYLPEIHLFYTISNNLTRKNEGDPEAGSDYGQTAYELTFGGVWHNPVATYLSSRVQDELIQVAVITQRRAIADVIYRIAQSLLKINMLEECIGLIESLNQAAKKRSAYSKVIERHSPGMASQAFYDEDQEKSAELQMRETKMELTLERTHLKQLVGLNLKQALKVDAKSVFTILASFHPQQLNWENCWEKTESYFLAHEQARLEQANILLAWAQYLPNISININENPPKGQSQPVDASSDQFLHLGLDFPFLDWGHRWRQAKIASERRRQRLLDEIQMRREYEENWLASEQRLMLAKARVENREQLAKTAEHRTEALEIAFLRGAVKMDILGDHLQRIMHARLNVVRARNAEAQTKLDWMHSAAGLASYFLGPAGFEKENSK